MNEARFLSWLVGFLFLECASLSAQAPDCAISRQITRAAPGAHESPTSVRVSVHIVDIVKLNEIEESFIADFILILRWRDERLAASARGSSLEDCVIRLDEVWNPGLELVNKRVVRKEWPDLVEVDAEGNVEYRQRFYGDLGSPLDLRSFPFDKQTLAIHIAANYDPEEVKILDDPNLTTVFPTADLSGWTIESFRSEVREREFLLGSSTSISILSSVLTVQRHVGSYVWKVFLPLTLIGLMAWAVFWVDPKHLGPQIGMSTASIFTLIAFLLGLRHGLPQISYLTKADALVLTGTVLVFSALAEALVAAHLADQDKRQQAVRLDRHARWIFPTIAVVAALTIVLT